MAVRTMSNRELQCVIDAMTERLNDLGVNPDNLSLKFIEKLCESFARRSVWIRDCWNVAAAVKWLDGFIERYDVAAWKKDDGAAGTLNVG